MIGEQLVADVVEVADQGYAHAPLQKRVADVGHGRGGLVAVDRDPHQFRARPRQGRDLPGGRLDVRGVGVGHRLDDDRRAPADLDPADTNGDGRTARARS